MLHEAAARPVHGTETVPNPDVVARRSGDCRPGNRAGLVARGSGASGCRRRAENRAAGRVQTDAGAGGAIGVERGDGEEIVVPGGQRAARGNRGRWRCRLRERRQDVSAGVNRREVVAVVETRLEQRVGRRADAGHGANRRGVQGESRRIADDEGHVRVDRRGGDNLQELQVAGVRRVDHRRGGTAGEVRDVHVLDVRVAGKLTAHIHAHDRRAAALIHRLDDLPVIPANRAWGGPRSVVNQHARAAEPAVREIADAGHLRIRGVIGVGEAHGVGRSKRRVLHVEPRAVEIEAEAALDAHGQPRTHGEVRVIEHKVRRARSVGALIRSEADRLVGKHIDVHAPQDHVRPRDRREEYRVGNAIRVGALDHGVLALAE